MRDSRSKPKAEWGLRPAARGLRLVRLLKRAVTLAVSAALCTAPASPLTAQSHLPSLGDAGSMSLGAERLMGERIAQDIYRDSAFVSDPVLDAYVAQIFERLVSAAIAQGYLSAQMHERLPSRVLLIADRSVNAFALPGGFFGVHLGLIAAVDSPDELASVMAHEITHFTQRHIVRGMDQQAAQTPLVVAAIVFGVLAARSNVDVANAALTTGAAGAVQGQLNFSRDMEREADRIGFSILQGAGFRTAAMGTMFDKLAHAARLNDSGNYPYLRSHPMTTERIADAQLRQHQYPHRHADTPTPGATATTPVHRDALSSDVHALLRARASVLMDTRAEALAGHLAAADVTLKNTDAPDIGKLYAGILSASLSKNTPLAHGWYTRLLQLGAGKFSPQATQAIRMLGAQIGAYGQLQPRLDLQSTQRAEMLSAARQLLGLANPEPLRAAASRLLEWTSVNTADAEAWELQARIALAQAHLFPAHSSLYRARASMALAEKSLAYFDVPAALALYQSAQSLLRSSPAAQQSAGSFEASIAESKVRQLQQRLHEQTQPRQAHDH